MPIQMLAMITEVSAQCGEVEPVDRVHADEVQGVVDHAATRC